MLLIVAHLSQSLGKRFRRHGKVWSWMAVPRLLLGEVRMAALILALILHRKTGLEIMMVREMGFTKCLVVLTNGTGRIDRSRWKAVES